MLTIVVAVDDAFGIGFRGALPWPRLRPDLEHFRGITARATPGKRNAVIMGRATWESVGCRPLPGRVNIVLTSSPPLVSPSDVVFASDLARAIHSAQDDDTIDQVFVIGGERVYADAAALPDQHRVLATRVRGTFPADRRFALPLDDPASYTRVAATVDRVDEATGLVYRFEELVRAGAVSTLPPRHEEHQYLDLVRRILDRGVLREDRTGVGTRALFGQVTRWSLEDGRMPLLTTKRMYWKGVVEELLWIMRGSTDARELAVRGVHVWDANARDAFRRGQVRLEGDLGPVYGFQWRHFGAEYVSCETAYGDDGVDQLREVVNRLREDPTSRRHVLCAWNPEDLPRMALPPCHVLVQFMVGPDRSLTSILYQRSGDVGLGVPWNIASYALLTHMVAHVTGLRAHEFVHVIGDAHVYTTHEAALREQVQREPLPFPRVRIDPDVTDIDDFRPEHIALEEYTSHSRVAMPMAV